MLLKFDLGKALKSIVICLYLIERHNLKSLKLQWNTEQACEYLQLYARWETQWRLDHHSAFSDLGQVAIRSEVATLLLSAQSQIPAKPRKWSSCLDHIGHTSVLSFIGENFNVSTLDIGYIFEESNEARHNRPHCDRLVVCKRINFQTEGAFGQHNIKCSQ